MLDGKTFFATLPAYDLERASHFYEDKLGLHRADIEAPGGIVYRTNGNQFFVYTTDAPRGGATTASFLVDDIEAEMRELREKGIEFEEYDQPGLKTDHGLAEFEGGKGAWFKDSEGNILALTQM